MVLELKIHLKSFFTNNYCMTRGVELDPYDLFYSDLANRITAVIGWYDLYNQLESSEPSGKFAEKGDKQKRILYEELKSDPLVTTSNEDIVEALKSFETSDWRNLEVLDKLHQLIHRLKPGPTGTYVSILTQRRE